jgi:hypothetical protein
MNFRRLGVSNAGSGVSGGFGPVFGVLAKTTETPDRTEIGAEIGDCRPSAAVPWGVSSGSGCLG